MLSGLTQKINFIPILTSMLTAGIVQGTFAGETREGEGGEEATTGGYFYHCFKPHRLEILLFLSN